MELVGELLVDDEGVELAEEETGEEGDGEETVMLRRLLATAAFFVVYIDDTTDGSCCISTWRVFHERNPVCGACVVGMVAIGCAEAVFGSATAAAVDTVDSVAGLTMLGILSSATSTNGLS
jgi:hypothetical protein